MITGTGAQAGHLAAAGGPARGAAASVSTDTARSAEDLVIYSPATWSPKVTTKEDPGCTLRA
jgi:hypothetical protein